MTHIRPWHVLPDNHFWDGDLFIDFAKDLARFDAKYGEETIESITHERYASTYDRIVLLQHIWRFTDVITHDLWMEQTAVRYQQYVRSKIIADNDLEEVLSI